MLEVLGRLKKEQWGGRRSVNAVRSPGVAQVSVRKNKSRSRVIVKSFSHGASCGGPIDLVLKRAIWKLVFGDRLVDGVARLSGRR